MTTLKIGDRVKGLDNGQPFTATVYDLYATNCGSLKRDDGKNGSGVSIPAYGSGWAFSNLSTYSLEIISSSSSDMTLQQKLVLAFKSEPEKSFIKAGITNIDGSFTSEGLQVFTAWLLKKYGNDFKAEVVDMLLAETEEKK
jgi:hypothetical protein